MDILSRIQNPPMEYRPQNYWGWLENITPDETRWQVQQMHAAGLGGYVMHARGGLTIPYMGQQWVDSVKAMIEEGEALGMLSI
ncbi:MAG: glycosyl hydrolase, partial [Anaerolineae bacterium]